MIFYAGTGSLLLRDPEQVMLFDVQQKRLYTVQYIRRLGKKIKNLIFPLYKVDLLSTSFIGK